MIHEMRLKVVKYLLHCQTQSRRGEVPEPVFSGTCQLTPLRMPPVIHNTRVLCGFPGLAMDLYYQMYK